MAWLECHPEVRVLNRSGMSHVLWKPAVLHRAAQCGLPIPETLVGNHIRRAKAFVPQRSAIVKPIEGGDYCRRLSDVLHRTETRDGAGARPVIIQPELVAPELRIYAVAGRFIGFRIHSRELDYRRDPNATVERLSNVPSHLTRGLGNLMAALGLDFCAADFKTCPTRNEPLFLEINDAPMFAAFDEASGGAIAEAIADFLLAGE